MMPLASEKRCMVRACQPTPQRLKVRPRPSGVLNSHKAVGALGLTYAQEALLQWATTCKPAELQAGIAANEWTNWHQRLPQAPAFIHHESPAASRAKLARSRHQNHVYRIAALDEAISDWQPRSAPPPRRTGNTGGNRALFSSAGRS
jgi:hypothetical protein